MDHHIRTCGGCCAMISELDRRIAELKGLKIDLLGGLSTNEPGVYELGPTWSTSDAKALELVDEIMSIGPGWSCHLDSAMLDREKLKESGFKIAERAEQWNCQLMHGLMICHGKGKTRPEAICRAYIAAREWMAGKGKA